MGEGNDFFRTDWMVCYDARILEIDDGCFLSILSFPPLDWVL